MVWAKEAAIWRIDDIDWCLPTASSTSYLSLLDLGLWLDFVDIDLYDSIWVTAIRRQSRSNKSFSPLRKPAFQGPWVMRILVSHRRALEKIRLDEITDVINNKDGIEIAPGTS